MTANFKVDAAKIVNHEGPGDFGNLVSVDSSDGLLIDNLEEIMKNMEYFILTVCRRLNPINRKSIFFAKVLWKCAINILYKVNGYNVLLDKSKVIILAEKILNNKLSEPLTKQNPTPGFPMGSLPIKSSERVE